MKNTTGIILIISFFIMSCTTTPTKQSSQGYNHGLAKFDLNSDGTITRQEFRAHAPLIFKHLDEDHDGNIELLHEKKSRMYLGLMKADSNNDRSLNQKEFMKRVDRFFENLDFDSDNILTADEIDGHTEYEL